MTADQVGEQDIRSINIDKLAKGFADDENVFGQYCNNSTTSAREIRWFQKTSGFIDTATTSGITKTFISNTSEGSMPFVVQQTWTRNTSYVQKFFAESEMITIEDVKDSDVDVLGTLVRDVMRAVDRKKDLHIYSVLVEAAAATPTVPNPTTTNTGAATADGWNDDATGNPIKDIMTMDQAIRAYGYNTKGAVLWMNEAEATHLMNYLITIKGSSIPQFSSDLMDKNQITSILGHPIVVSHNYPTDSVAMLIPGVTLTYKTFMAPTGVKIEEQGIGIKIRCWEEGVCIMTDPKSAYILTATIA